MKNIETRKDRRWWLGQHSAWEKSGQSIVAFCKERGINHQSFYKWRSTFKEEGRVNSCALAVQHERRKQVELSSSDSPATQPQTSFVEMTFDCSTPASEKTSTMMLENPNGWRIRVSSTAGFESLQKAVALLDGLS